MSQPEHYCTLFNSTYLARGLTLYRSIEKHGEPFVLHVLCMDQDTYEVLGKLELKNLVRIHLKDFETPALLKAKSDRSLAEYCWTCTSSVIQYCLKKTGASQVTYVDADLYFFSSPKTLVAEMLNAGGSVSLTEHRYTKQYAGKTTEAGTYCVQFMTFKKDIYGTEALQWWTERCLEWCYARVEDGKFGDQKYLDDWLTRFKKIHVLKDHGCGIAPWNVQQFSVSTDPEQGVLIDGHPLRFYHFHNLKLLGTNKADLCRTFYYLSENVQNLIYKPYLKELSRSLLDIQKIKPGRYDLFKEKFKGHVLNTLRAVSRRYYVMEI